MLTITVNQKHKASALPWAAKVCWIGAQHGFDLAAAKSSSIIRDGPRFDWSDEFVEELRLGLQACKAL